MKDVLGSGTTGWLALALFVTLWDRYADETLSSAWGRGCEKAVGKVALWGLWGVTTAHLFERIPERFDPYHHLANAIGPDGRVAP